MKRFEFPGNAPGFYGEYIRTKEGPNRFVVLYKNSCTMHFDPKNAWRRLEVAKFTDMGKALKEWCVEMDATYGADAKEGYEDGSFANDTKTVM